MIIQEIELKDFRPFNGIQKITLSEDLNKNITFINAENGSGKTTLLEAIKWCLYGIINLPNKDEFVNKKTGANMLIDESVTVSVKVTFKDEEYTYAATRWLEFTKKSATNFSVKNKPELKLIKINKDGVSQKVSAPEMEISRIIPKEMNFFFDGERLANFDDKSTLKKAIEGILGVETTNNALKHLKGAKKQINDELINLQRKLGNTTVVALREKVESLDFSIDRNKSEILRLNKEIELANKQLEDKKDKQQAIKSIEEFATKKREKEKSAELIAKEIENQEIKIRNHHSTLSHTVPITKLIEDAAKILQEKKKKKEVPSKVSEFLINELIENRKCICGCEIEPNSKQHKTLEELKKSSSSDKMIDAFDAALRLTESEMSKRLNFYNTLKLHVNLLERLNLEKDNLDKEIVELDKKIDKNQNEEGQLLKNSIADLNSKIYEFNQKIGGLKKEIDQKIKEKDELEKRIRVIESNNEEVNLLIKRTDFCDKLTEDFEIILKKKKELIRNELIKKIKKIYSEATRKGYEIILNDDFIISIIDSETKKNIPVSTGEQKIATLCFVGALADLARSIHKRKSDVENGKIYPIILDSPFGDLDNEHRLKLVKILPALADQIVLLTSSSQATEEMRRELLPRVGEMYKLHNNKNQNSEEKYEVTYIYKKNEDGKWEKNGVYN